MASRRILDELSGYDFEDMMMEVYQKQGYENVRNPGKSGDEGRDILMEKNGKTYVVECKHIKKVGRPKVQKLHSAVSTYPAEDATGILVTTGEFTRQAKEYTEKVNNGEEVLRLTDGNDLREIGEDIGLDLYSGKIEVLCKEAVKLPTEREEAEQKVKEKFDDVRNFSQELISDIHIEVEMVPAIHINAKTDAVFETTVGKIHSINARDSITMKAGKSGSDFSDDILPEIVPESVADRNGTVELNEEKFSEIFDGFQLKRYEKTETDYKDEIKEEIKDRHEKTVPYTGDNNVDYEKDCRPKNSDIKIESTTPVYVPLVKSEVDTGDYQYEEEFYTSNQDDVIEKDGIHHCVHCSLGEFSIMNFTFCENCGSINCILHTRKERKTGEPICTECGVTERFFLRKRFFYNEENLREFRKEFEEKPVYGKAVENKPLIATALIAMIIPLII